MAGLTHVKKFYSIGFKQEGRHNNFIHILYHNVMIEAQQFFYRVLHLEK